MKLDVNNIDRIRGIIQAYDAYDTIAQIIGEYLIEKREYKSSDEYYQLAYKTLKNIIELIKQHKKVTVFLQQEKKFQRVYNVDEFLLITQKMSELSLKNADKKINIYKSIASLKKVSIQPSFL